MLDSRDSRKNQRKEMCGWKKDFCQCGYVRCSLTMSVADRLAVAIRFKPEMCSLNMGSMNFAIFPAANRIKKWKYSWEEGYVRNSDDFIFRNTFRDIKYILETMSDAGTKFEHECYDVGHL